MTEKYCVYRIPFTNKGELYEIYAKNVDNSDLFGFLEVSDIVWGSTGSLVIDPMEERLRNEFKGVNCTFIPLHAVMRIDVVEKPGTAKITPIAGGNNVTPFPAPIYTPHHTLQKE